MNAVHEDSFLWFLNFFLKYIPATTLKDRTALESKLCSRPK